MRWSFGEARFTADEVQALLDPWKAMVAEYNTMYCNLVEKYHELKVSGATTPDQRPAMVKREVDPIMSVIADVGGRDSALRRHLGKYVREQRANGVDDSDILQTLQHWPEDEEMSA